MRYFIFACRVGQEDNKKLSDYQMNAIKHKSMELKNRFDTLFYDPECDSTDYKSESKDLRIRSLYVLFNSDVITLLFDQGPGDGNCSGSNAERSWKRNACSHTVL